MKNSSGSSVLPTRNGDDTAALAPSTPDARIKTIDIVPGADETDESYIPLTVAPDDSYLLSNFLTPAQADAMLHALTPAENGGGGEIAYQQWYHMPNKKGKCEPLRRTKIAMGRPSPPATTTTQEDSLDGLSTPDGGTIPNEKKELMPLYRFPVNDQQRYGIFPFTNTIEKLCQNVMEKTNGLWDFNHSVVLFYKDGDDCIGFHKDKTLDLVDGSPVVSISLGNPRQYVLRDEIFTPKEEARMTLAHGALFYLGAATNDKYYHSITKQPDTVCGPRVSITFRAVATFKADDGMITGKGEDYRTGNWPVELRGQHVLGEINASGVGNIPKRAEDSGADTTDGEESSSP